VSAVPAPAQPRPELQGPEPAPPVRPSMGPAGGAGAGMPRFLGGETARSLVAHASTCSCGGTCPRCRAARQIAEG
jgi:hypothetical protein